MSSTATVANLQSGGGASSGLTRTLSFSIGRVLRAVLWLLTHSIYRITVLHPENVPATGGALMVSNHMSWVDALLLGCSTHRDVRFVMFQEYYEKPFLKPFLKLFGAIPISNELNPREMLHSLREAGNAVRRGELVCIFAEGQITRTGQLLPFRRGFSRVMKNVEAPIIPVHLDGMWGSIFSYESGKVLLKWPRRIPYPVTVSFGKPLPATATPAEVRNAVVTLSTDAFALHRQWLKPLHREMVHTCRRNPFRMGMADVQAGGISYASVLNKTMFLARRLRRVWQGQQMVGLLLPPSIGGALVNQAAMLLGKVPVNLNYTAGAEVIGKCVEQCGITTIVTSKAFLEKVPIELPGKVLFLEDLAAEPRVTEKLTAVLLAWLLPIPLLERALGRKQTAQPDDLATVVFSSGSTGEPKGVMLSHFNIAANIEQVSQVFDLNETDRIFGILPFFHSFGFTVTLWLPAVLGKGAVFYPNPLDARTIGYMCRKYAVTFMVATPTFLQTYTRRCEAEDFGSLRYVLAGAEKLPERISLAFEDKFGIRPLEGYGATECAPVVAVNTRDYRAAGFRQVGAKRGTIGRPLPGISVKLVDRETGAELTNGGPGVLHIKGPNVMLGYLNQPERTAAVLHDGWYNTGDLATVDEDGFISIADRLSRFSKIGGEMVPHVNIEEKLHELADVHEQTFVVTGVPDERKGERIVVLHLLAEEQLAPVLDRLSESDLPPLWRPRPHHFFRVAKLPYLGTGKLDLRALKEQATKLADGASS